MRFLRTNTATRVTVGPFLDKTDGITPETGLTATNEKITFMVDTGGVPTLVIDATATASGGDNDLVHVTNDDAGYYDLELTAAQTNYVGRAHLAITYATDHCPVFHEFTILPANVYDTVVAGTQWHMNALAAGTADSGTTTTCVDAARTEATNDWWKGQLIVFTSGTLLGQTALITGFTAASDTITFAPAVTTAVSTHTYEIVPAQLYTLAAVAARTNNANLNALLGVTDSNGHTVATATADQVYEEATADHQTAGTYGVRVTAADVASAVATTQVADAVPADGTRPTVQQALYMIVQFLMERSVSSTTVTVKKPDGTTALMTFTLDDATDPTSITRAS